MQHKQLCCERRAGSTDELIVQRMKPSLLAIAALVPRFGLHFWTTTVLTSCTFTSAPVVERSVAAQPWF